MRFTDMMGLGRVLFIQAGPRLSMWNTPVIAKADHGVPKHAQTKRANWKSNRRNGKKRR